jgi:hypothetical protein
MKLSSHLSSSLEGLSCLSCHQEPDSETRVLGHQPAGSRLAFGSPGMDRRGMHDTGHENGESSLVHFGGSANTAGIGAVFGVAGTKCCIHVASMDYIHCPHKSHRGGASVVHAAFSVKLNVLTRTSDAAATHKHTYTLQNAAPCFSTRRCQEALVGSRTRFKRFNMATSSFLLMAKLCTGVFLISLSSL